MPKKHRVIVLDRHPMFREGIKVVATRSRAFDVVGEAGVAGEGVRLVKRLKPDLVLVDLFLPDLDDAKAIVKLLKAAPAARVLMVGGRAAIGPIAAAVAAGASGFIAKTAEAGRLMAAMAAVLQGDTFLDGVVSGPLATQLASSSAPLARTAEAGQVGLTPRETEILRLLAEGHASRAIAAALYISPKTVDNHRANIMRKLRLDNTVGMVRYAASIGLIDVAAWQA